MGVFRGDLVHGTPHGAFQTRYTLIMEAMRVYIRRPLSVGRQVEVDHKTAETMRAAFFRNQKILHAKGPHTSGASKIGSP